MLTCPFLLSILDWGETTFFLYAVLLRNKQCKSGCILFYKQIILAILFGLIRQLRNYVLKIKISLIIIYVPYNCVCFLCLILCNKNSLFNHVLKNFYDLKMLGFFDVADFKCIETSSFDDLFNS